MSFTEMVMEKARADKKTIVLAEGFDVRMVEAASEAQALGIANIVLLGNPAEVEKLAAGKSLEGVTIVDVETSDKLDAYAAELYELRKSKGMTMEKAAETIKNPLYFGAMMTKLGDADGMVAGAANSTADVLRSALQVIKAKKGVSTVSSSFVMIVPDKSFGANGTFVFGDCALVIDPTAEEMAAIAISSAETAKNLCGIDPVVAMMSFSTKGSGKDATVDKVVEATKIAKEMRPDLALDGELQADAALVEAVGKSKAPGSPVPGHANVLIFPNINAGNIGYKLVQRLAHAEALGPVIQGLAKPVNDLSRGCSADDIVKVVAITAVQAQNN